jgi:hypothetical protein
MLVQELALPPMIRPSPRGVTFDATHWWVGASAGQPAGVSFSGAPSANRSAKAMPSRGSPCVPDVLLVAFHNEFLQIKYGRPLAERRRLDP